MIKTKTIIAPELVSILLALWFSTVGLTLLTSINGVSLVFLHAMFRRSFPAPLALEISPLKLSRLLRKHGIPKNGCLRQSRTNYGTRYRLYYPDSRGLVALSLVPFKGNPSFPPGERTAKSPLGESKEEKVLFRNSIYETFFRNICSLDEHKFFSESDLQDFFNAFIYRFSKKVVYSKEAHLILTFLVCSKDLLKNQLTKDNQENDFLNSFYLDLILAQENLLEENKLKNFYVLPEDSFLKNYKEGLIMYV